MVINVKSLQITIKIHRSSSIVTSFQEVQLAGYQYNNNNGLLIRKQNSIIYCYRLINVCQTEHTEPKPVNQLDKSFNLDAPFTSTFGKRNINKIRTIYCIIHKIQTFYKIQRKYWKFSRLKYTKTTCRALTVDHLRYSEPNTRRAVVSGLGRGLCPHTLLVG